MLVNLLNIFFVFGTALVVQVMAADLGSTNTEEDEKKVHASLLRAEHESKESFRLEQIQKDFSSIGYNQDSVNNALKGAAEIGYQKVVKWLIELPKEQLRPNQHGINLAVDAAAKNDRKEIIELLLSPPRAHRQSTQPGCVNKALGTAAESGVQSMVEFLLDRPNGKSQPSMYGVNGAFLSAVKKDQVDLVEWFLNRPAGHPRPSQVFGVNKALECAAGVGSQRMVEMLLSREEGQLRPDQNAIVNAYREAIANVHPGIIRLFATRVPFGERQYQEMGRGLAFEVHNYADAQVTSSKIAKDSKDTQSTRLIDAVWKNMTDRLYDVKLMSFSDVEIILGDAIDEWVSPDKREEAKMAALYRLASDLSYEQELSLTVTFIQTFHVSKMEQWIHGFVGESITAYANRSNPTGCSKGTKERVATGLRGIDLELDKLFAQVEGPVLMRNWLKTWNLIHINDEAKQNLARQLIDKGVNGKSSMDDVIKVFLEIVNKQLDEYGVRENPCSIAEMEAYSDMIQDNYETLLKPFVEKSSL